MERHYCKANETLELVGQAGKCKFIVYDMIGKGTMSVGYRAFRQAPNKSGWRSLYEFCPKALQAGSIVYERKTEIPSEPCISVPYRARRRARGACLPLLRDLRRPAYREPLG